jgi:serine/threonine protein kinase
LVSAVAFMQSGEIGIVHRDLSLKNIFLGWTYSGDGVKEMQVKIGDFGMALEVRQD